MFHDYILLDRIFLYSAVICSVYFIVQIILLISGIGNVSANSEEDINANIKTSFKIFTVNNMASFLMMFGWIGLAFHKQYKLNISHSLVISITGGVVSMLLIAVLFLIASKLTSAETIRDFIGKTGTVFHEIGSDYGGKIQISLDGDMTKEINAISYDKSNIEQFSTVEVVKIINKNLVSVKKIKN